MTETKVEYTAKQQSRYVRLNLTTLYQVPDCYGGEGKPDSLSDACLHCFLKKQCQEKQEVLLR